MKALILAVLLPLPAMAQDQAAMCASVLDALHHVDASAGAIHESAREISGDIAVFAVTEGQLPRVLQRTGDATGQIATDLRALTDAANQARTAIMAYCAP